MNYLILVYQTLDKVNLRIGRFASWVSLVLVLVQFSIVFIRYVFNYGFVWLQESVLYLHSILFMVGAAYTLLHDNHVRIDIFYQKMSQRMQAIVNLFGSVFFLMPVCVLIITSSMPYVHDSWRVLEGSRDINGIPAVFLLKSLIILFAVLLLMQGISMALKNSLFIFCNHQTISNKSQNAAL